MAGLGSLFGSLFGGDSSKPYKKAMEQFQKYYNEAKGYQQPYYEAGNKALGGYEDWLEKMKDPSKYINDLQSQYQESPYNKYLQDEAMRQAQYAGSASGLTGSTPLMQQMQQNAANIAGQGQQDWMKNVLGINTEYGGGLNTLAGRGQSAANNLSELSAKLAELMGQGKYGEGMAKNQRISDIFSGLFDFPINFGGGGGGGGAGGQGGGGADMAQFMKLLAMFA